MKLGIYSIFDRVGGTYGDPFLAQNVQTAERRFNYIMSKSDMIAGDCELYSLGSFDVESGSLIPSEKPVFVTRYQVEEVKDE